MCKNAEERIKCVFFGISLIIPFIYSKRALSSGAGLQHY